MQNVHQGFKGLSLLIDVNSDRLLTILAIAVAMAAVGWIGVEYANGSFVQEVAPSISTFL